MRVSEAGDGSDEAGGETVRTRQVVDRIETSGGEVVAVRMARKRGGTGCVHGQHGQHERKRYGYGERYGCNQLSSTCRGMFEMEFSGIACMHGHGAFTVVDDSVKVAVMPWRDK